ncbi:DUF2510 domain-containing protein [Leifsonia sp. PS1209]|uniref:DUF2510 domain-containing protein n=1 Tax=Leifsonia sp. PS1209 TaxID=2724914 RepID=UPI001442DCE0|nr:DUF2510 domain-containing protein [Leifsonia sp. PS1209]QIZ97459.1 DUF2510 domain-containing protein [Leifsonia sp. PS1209]
MTNTDAHVPAGWYPDPSGAQQLRWWDGTQWTAHFAPLAGAAQAQQQQPVQPQPVYAQPAYTQQPGYPQQPAYGQTYAPVRPRLADGARIYNVYIWLVVALPFVSLVLLPFYQPHFDVVATEHGYTSYGNPFGMFGPMYFAIVGIGFLAYALSVVFSWLDYRELERIGVVRPFHWAWTFLSALVYVIGRSVIVRRVAPGRGLAPIWVTIGLYVLSLIVTIAWTVSLVSTMVHDLPMQNLGA